MRSTFRFASAVLACAASLAFVGCTDNNGDAGPSSFTLSVTLGGNGTGTVTSNSSPALNCGTTCSVVLAAGTSTTLTATPTNGSTFSGWSGVSGCSSASTCTVTVNADMPSVTATFVDPDSPTPAGVIGLTSNQKLISFVRSAPDATPVSSVSITGLASGETAVGIDYRPSDGKLYGLIKSTSGARVCQLDPKFGAASACFPLRTAPLDATTAVALSGTAFGIDFNPTADRLRVVSSSGQNLRINVADGTTIVDSALNGAATGASAAAYTNNYPSSTGTALFVINDADDSLYLQNPPNSGTMTKVGALGVSTSGASGFDVIGTGAGTADTSNEALLAAITGGLSRLYTVDLGSGAATLIASIETGADDTVTMVDLAIKPSGTQLVAGDTYALQDGNKLISFNRATPGSILTRTFVAGLKSGDQLVGMDFRPADFKLYALGLAGNLYTLDTASGVATHVASLQMNSTDTVDPKYSGLNSGAGFGVDFDPRADSGKGTLLPASLRVIDSTGQTFMVIVDGADAGKVTRYTNTSDDPAAIPPGGSRANHGGFRAAGYTNSFFNTDSQTLFAVDSDRDILYRISQAAATNITESEPVQIGALGADVSTKDGLDIDGITGEAWFVAVVGGQAKLHQLNLTSGALGGSGATIGDGTLDIRGLALPPLKKPVIYGLTADGKILSFAPEAPDVLLTGPLTVSGLSGGDTLVALHVRPSDYKLFALSRVGNLYTIDPTPTAAPSSVYTATLVAGASLRPDANDNVTPFFTSLPTTGTVAMDFDPRIAGLSGVAALRIIGASGAQYLRADVANGNTFADKALIFPDPEGVACDFAAANDVNIAAAAYNKAGTLFVINADSSASCLYTAPADGGAMTSVGPIFEGPAPDVTETGGTIDSSMGGFDIVGSHDGLILAVLDADGSSQSTIYTMSLGTSDLHRANNGKVIGPSGTPKLIDMTILLRP